MVQRAFQRLTGQRHRPCLCYTICQESGRVCFHAEYWPLFIIFLKITNILLWLCISNYLVTLSPSPSALTSPHCLPVPILCTTWLPHYLLPSNTVCQLLSLNHWSLTASQSFIVATRIDCLPFPLKLLCYYVEFSLNDLRLYQSERRSQNA